MRSVHSTGGVIDDRTDALCQPPRSTGLTLGGTIRSIARTWLYNRIEWSQDLPQRMESAPQRLAHPMNSNRKASPFRSPQGINVGADDVNYNDLVNK